VEDDDYSLAAAARLGDPRAQLMPFDPERLETVLYRFSPPTRFGQAYRAAIERAGDITCFTQAHALRLHASWNAGRVERLVVGRLGQDGFEIRARHFVLAAGAIENARLLLLSTDVAPAGLGNGHDLVGRYFMDHPHTRRAILAATPPLSLAFYGLALRHHGLAAGISPSEKAQEDERILNYKASVYPVYRGQDAAGWTAFLEIALRFSRRWGKDPYNRLRLPFERKQISPAGILKMLQRPDKMTLAVLAQVLKTDRLIAGFVLESKPEQAPNRDSRITLQEKRDPFGLPRARVDWRLLPIDRRTVMRAEELIDAELERLHMGRLAPAKPEEHEAWPSNLIGGWHQIGTTRAHSDPRQGVVDADCRVHGIDNLFVAGASVFPTGGSVSPTPTILALALRLADHLKERLRAPAPLHAGALTSSTK
jgi:choline dehydrogenase-like flavoprotein